jgi:hypothetical protein
MANGKALWRDYEGMSCKHFRLAKDGLTNTFNNQRARVVDVNCAEFRFTFSW